MNLLKSIFISNYMMAEMALAGYAGWMIYSGNSIYPWAGVLLTSAPIIMYIGYLMMLKPTARTSAHFPLINLMGIIGVSLTVVFGIFKGEGLLTSTLSIISYISFIAYSYWYSTYGRKSSQRIEVGKTLPDFSVTNAKGQVINSKQLTDKPSIFIFYRGNWCPLCMAQIKEIASKYKEISNMGVRVALISPQPHSNTESLAKKFNVPFDFLTDKGNHAARALGINQKDGLPMGMQMMGYDSETVLPTVIITDKGGKILWTHETDNYRVRPEPETYLKVLNTQSLGHSKISLA